jgi:nucleotide-binding universal stress UspA family protein
VNGGTALASRPPRFDRTDRLVVVSEDQDLPGWVHDWCRRAERELYAHRLSASGAGHRPAPADLLTEIVTLGADPILVVRRDTAGLGRSEVTAAIHDLPDDAPVLAAAADTARQLGAPLVLTHGLPVSFAERSVGLTMAEEHARRLLDTAAQRLVDDVPDVTVVTRLVRAHPHELVGEDLDTGLLVIGGPRRHVCDDLGLVARSALHHAACPLLIAPR